MEKSMLVAGYGDRTWHLRLATGHWRYLYKTKLLYHRFGTRDDPESYDQHWQECKERIQRERPRSIIGVSFGSPIALRALIEIPDIVKKAICIAGPNDKEYLDKKTVDDDYPMLNPALEAIKQSDIPAKDVMTLRSLNDETIDQKAVLIPGAHNQIVGANSHAAAVIISLATKGREMTEFIRSHEVAA